MSTEALNPKEIAIDALPPGSAIYVRTARHTYRLTAVETGYLSISGHPRHCPRPVYVKLAPLQGLTDAPERLTVGRPLVYVHPEFGIVMTTKVQEIHCEVPPAAPRRKRLLARLFRCCR